MVRSPDHVRLSLRLIQLERKREICVVMLGRRLETNLCEIHNMVTAKDMSLVMGIILKYDLINLRYHRSCHSSCHHKCHIVWSERQPEGGDGESNCIAQSGKCSQGLDGAGDHRRVVSEEPDDNGGNS